MAGLRVSVTWALPGEAHDGVELTLGRLLPLRLQLGERVWGAWEQIVANRRDELRGDTNLRRLLVVVRKAEQLRFGPATADEGDPDRQPWT